MVPFIFYSFYLGKLHGYSFTFSVYGPHGIARLLISVLSWTNTIIGNHITIYEFLKADEELSSKSLI